MGHGESQFAAGTPGVIHRVWGSWAVTRQCQEPWEPLGGCLTAWATSNYNRVVGRQIVQIAGFSGLVCRKKLAFILRTCTRVRNRRTPNAVVRPWLRGALRQDTQGKEVPSLVGGSLER